MVGGSFGASSSGWSILGNGITLRFWEPLNILLMICPRIRTKRMHAPQLTSTIEIKIPMRIDIK